jgi:hypothetical protein
MRKVVWVGVALMSLTVSSGIAVADGMNPGKWHITTEGVTMMGSQKIVMPKNEMDNCLTPQQAKQAADATTQQGECKTEVLSKNGNETKTRSTCPTSVSTIDMTVTGDTYTSVSHTEMKQGETKIVSDITATGKRVGDCTQ